eukprot:m51a1_g4246 hypothetical protein (725) ;mRNA; r:194391-197075
MADQVQQEKKSPKSAFGQIARMLSKFFHRRPSAKDLQERNVLQGPLDDGPYAGEHLSARREKAATLLDLRLSHHGRKSRDDLLSLGIMKECKYPVLPFGISLVDLHDMNKNAEGGVPSFLWRCAEVVLRNIDTEGLFRVNGGGKQIRDLKGIAESGGDIPADVDIHAVTGVIGNFLRSLPEPVLSFDLYEELISLAKEYDDQSGSRISAVRQCSVAALRDTLKKLPVAHYEMLRWLVELLFMVTLCSDKNRMAPENVGTVFGPTLIRARDDSLESLTSLRFNAIIVDILVRNYFELFPFDPVSPDTLLSTARELPERLKPHFSAQISAAPVIQAAKASLEAATEGSAATTASCAAQSASQDPRGPVPSFRAPATKPKPARPPPTAPASARPHSKSALPSPNALNAIVAVANPSTSAPGSTGSMRPLPDPTQGAGTLPRNFSLADHKRAMMTMRAKPLPATPRRCGCGDLFGGRAPRPLPTPTAASRTAAQLDLASPQAQPRYSRSMSATATTRAKPPVPARTDLMSLFTAPQGGDPRTRTPEPSALRRDMFVRSSPSPVLARPASSGKATSPSPPPPARQASAAALGRPDCSPKPLRDNGKSASAATLSLPVPQPPAGSCARMASSPGRPQTGASTGMTFAAAAASSSCPSSSPMLSKMQLHPRTPTAAAAPPSSPKPIRPLPTPTPGQGRRVLPSPPNSGSGSWPGPQVGAAPGGAGSPPAVR